MAFPSVIPFRARRLVTCTLMGLALMQGTSTMAQSQKEPAPPQTASFSVETALSVSTDRRSRGISDSLRRPSVQLAITAAHESGLLGMVQLDTVSKRSFPEGNGLGVTMAGGYRWGDPEGMHYGLGVATEFFPGAKLPLAPTSFDPNTGAFDGFQQGNFNTSFALLEAGWNFIELRYIYVISENYRGANTASICGTLVQRPDPTAGINCYLKGNKGTRGSQLLDVDLKYPISGNTHLLAHWGLQHVANFKEANAQDWRLGIQHKRWGVDMTAEVVGAKTKTRELYLATDSAGRSRRLDNTAVVLTVTKKF